MTDQLTAPTTEQETDRQPTPPPPTGYMLQPVLIHDPGTCGLCDALREGNG